MTQCIDEGLLRAYLLDPTALDAAESTSIRVSPDRVRHLS